MDEHDNVTQLKAEKKIEIPFEAITAAAAIGILLYTRKNVKISKTHLKLIKTAVENNDVAVKRMKDVILAAKNAGTPFEYFPGLGVLVG